MFSRGVKTSRSASPETMQSASAARAASRNLSSLGLRQAVTLRLGVTAFPRQRNKLMRAEGDVIQIDVYFLAKIRVSKHVNEFHQDVRRVNGGEASIAQGEQHIASSSLVADQRADQHPYINPRAHGLFPRRFDIGGQFFFADRGVHFRQTVPCPVERHQHLALLHLLKAQVVFVRNRHCFRARAARQDARSARADHLAQKRAKFALEFVDTNDVLHIRLL